MGRGRWAPLGWPRRIAVTGAALVVIGASAGAGVADPVHASGRRSAHAPLAAGRTANTVAPPPTDTPGPVPTLSAPTPSPSAPAASTPSPAPTPDPCRPGVDTILTTADASAPGGLRAVWVHRPSGPDDPAIPVL